MLQIGVIGDGEARGAASQKGMCVGILPGDSKEDANEYIDIRIVTSMSHARNAIIARTADVLITVGGGAGTLSEVVLGLKTKKPVIMIRDALPKFRVDDEGIYFVSKPGEAVGLAEKISTK
jgi:uncharacterized protein (TIGR00725 family)